MELLIRYPRSESRHKSRHHEKDNTKGSVELSFSGVRPNWHRGSLHRSSEVIVERHLETKWSTMGRRPTRWDCNQVIKWSEELTMLGEIEMRRSYFEGCVESMELHMFGDSSQDVFSAVAFLRGKVTAANRTSTELAFVFGKDKVAPMKAPRFPSSSYRPHCLPHGFEHKFKMPSQ